jgi:hypothetical protein
MSDHEEDFSESIGSEYSESTDGDYSDDGDFHPNSEADDEEEEARHAELMGDLRKALELFKAHFEKCATPKAHLYLAMIDQGADALDAYWGDLPAYGF